LLSRIETLRVWTDVQLQRHEPAGTFWILIPEHEAPWALAEVLGALGVQVLCHAEDVFRSGRGVHSSDGFLADSSAWITQTRTLLGHDGIPRAVEHDMLSALERVSEMRATFDRWARFVRAVPHSLRDLDNLRFNSVIWTADQLRRALPCDAGQTFDDAMDMLLDSFPRSVGLQLPPDVTWDPIALEKRVSRFRLSIRQGEGDAIVAYVLRSATQSMTRCFGLRPGGGPHDDLEALSRLHAEVSEIDALRRKHAFHVRPRRVSLAVSASWRPWIPASSPAPSAPRRPRRKSSR
jgi:hypothetical protein